MPIAHLLHPVPIVLEQIDRPDTIYDEDAREAVQVVSRKIAVTVPGQVKWNSDMSLNPGREGASEDASGYVLFSLPGLAALSISLSRGDRILSIGGRACEVYVERTEPCGHYPDAGGPTLLKAHFGTRGT
jgi:hypothetical protein